jgi:hypothetical protein
MTLPTFTIRTQQLTRIFMGVAGLAIIGYDVAMSRNRTAGDTISEVTTGFVATHPLAWLVIMLGIGILLGHLFFPQRIGPDGKVL